MDPTDPTGTAQRRLEGPPADYARSLGRRPVLSASGLGWENVSLERFHVPFLELRLGALNVHMVSFHLAGPVLIERIREGSYDRRWTHSGCSNLIPAGVPVTKFFKGQAEFMVAYVAPSIVDEVGAEVFSLDPARVRLVESLAVPDEKLGQFGQLLLAEAEAGGVGTRLFTDTITRALALHLLRTYSPESPQAQVPQGPMVSWRLRKAIDCMHANLAVDLPLSQLAAEAGLSPSHFARAFRAAVGEPPHRHMIRLRIERARHLLEHTRLPVIEIGYRCGFEQTTHFATMFRKLTGFSPRAYRAARCT